MNPLVFITLAVYEPNKAFFLKQLHSIKQQSYKNFVCLCFADGPHDQILNEIADEINDERFRYASSTEHLGVFNTFGRGLLNMPDEAEWVAFCDQDDIWHPDKLRICLQTLTTSGAELVYSDARVIDQKDDIMAESYFKFRRRVTENSLKELFLKNCISGMSMMFSRRIANLSLPFISQDPPFIFYHDGWVCLVALANAKVAYIDQPLLDYRIHDNSASGKKRKIQRLPHILKHSILIMIRPFKIERCISIYASRAKVYRLLQKHSDPNENHLNELTPYFHHKKWMLFYLDMFYSSVKKGELYRAKTVVSMFCAKVYFSLPLLRIWAVKQYKRSASGIKKFKIGI